MKTPHQSIKLTMFLSLLLGCAAMSACEVNEETISSTPSTPTCDEELVSDPNLICQDAGLVIATQDECDASAACQTLSTNLACGEEMSVLCQEPLEHECLESGRIPPEVICEEAGLVLATIEECAGDPTCQTVITEGPCDQAYETLCRVSDCAEARFPDAESVCLGLGLALANNRECSDDAGCQMIEFQSECNVISIALCIPISDPECREDGRIEPGLICEGEGLVLASEEECAGSAMCHLITTEGPCDLVYETLCKEVEDPCLAVPTCRPPLAPSDRTCLRGEEDCELVTECGQTISCRPEVTCAAVPTCERDEIESRFGCEEGEEACHAVTLCAETIFCRPDTRCRAIPSCGEGEIESRAPCLASESTEACRAVSMCGTTITCR